MARAKTGVTTPDGEGALPAVLRRHRTGAGLSQEELARLAGVGVRTVSDLERGRVARPRGHTVRQLAAALKLDRKQTADLLRLAASASGTAWALLESGQAHEQHTLPPDLPDFTGRRAELAAARVAATVAVGAYAPRVLIVVGMAGVGKTAFAVHLADQLAAEYPDGLIYVNLRGLDPDPLSVPQALSLLLAGLGARDSHAPADPEVLLSLYRSDIRQRCALILLDNAADEAQVRPLLPPNNSCLTIVTSRNVLSGLDRGHTVALDCMSMTDAVQTLDAILRPARPRPDPDALQALAACCGRLPLALRIAATRLATRPDLGVAELVTRLGDARERLDELVAGDRSVQSVFDMSYYALPKADRSLFRRLALLPGEFDADEAGAVIGFDGPHVRRRLDRLVDLSLVQPAPGGRYRLHELMRLYAERRLAVEGEDVGDTALRPYDWYVNRAGQPAAAYFSSAIRLPHVDPSPGSRPDLAVGFNSAA